jgi:hypothetical protein
MLGTQYAGLLPVVQERLPDFELLEAHICSAPGSPRKYVHFICRRQGKILSLILTRRDGKSLPEGRFLEAKVSGGVNLYHARLDGMDVAGFESSQYFGFVVSDLAEDEVLRIATRLAPPVRAELDGPSTQAALASALMAFSRMSTVEAIWRMGIEDGCHRCALIEEE